MSWVMPLFASAFWTGILAWPAMGGFSTPGVLLALGFLALSIAVFLAPVRRGDPGPLQASGLIREPDPEALQAVRAPRESVARGPPWALAIAAAAGFILWGAGWSGLHEQRLAGSYLARSAGHELTLVGALETDPKPGAFGWSALMGVSEARTPAGLSANGGGEVRLHEKVWLERGGDVPSLRRGDRLEASGLVVSPSSEDFSRILLHHGIAVAFEANEVSRLGPSSNPLVRAAQSARSFLLRHMRASFSPRDAGLLMGLALGDTSMLDPGDERHFRATGLGHLLAVSGENVAMVLAPVLGLALLLRLSAAGKFVLGGVTVLFFVVLTGAEPSVLRAGVMAGLALLGALLGRPRSTATILGAAVLILLVSDPNLVWSIGFQLSVAATAGIVALAGPLSAKLSRLPRPLAIAAATTMAAQAGVSPLLLYHFHQVQGVTLLANLLAFPAVAPAMLLGLAAAAGSALVPPLATLLAHVAALFVRYLEGLADRLASAPLPSVTSAGGLVPLVVGLAFVALLAVWARSSRRLPRAFVVAALLVVPVFVWSTALRAGPPSGLVVRFLDVGQGDAALVTSPQGANVLIDGGPDPELVATKLSALGVKRLDLVIATHPHLDHYVGLPSVLAQFPVGLVADSGCDPPESRSASYRDFLRAVQEEGVPEEHPTRGDVLVVGDLRFEVLSPDRCWNGTNSDPNNDSLVLLLSYRGDTVLFANEPEADAQQVMLDDNEPITAEVLNVPHHGAGTSILPFFQAVHEEIAVVSVGPNSYGHPVPRTLQWLRQTGARVFRTDRTGDVTVEFESPGIVVVTGTGRKVVLQSPA